eukprot:PITA_06603
MAKGFSRVEEIDYNKNFSLIAWYSTIRSIIALSAQMGWKIHQMDVKTTLLNDMIEEEVYIEKLEGFETLNKESHVCRLNEVDVNLDHIVVEGKLLIIVLYVDDLVLTGDDNLIKPCKEDLVREFEMKDLGLIHYFFGMEVWQGDEELFVPQGKYANDILKKFVMERSKPMETPLAGPYKCYVVNQLSQVMVKPTKLYWKAAKHLLRYLKGTTQFVLNWYRQTKGLKLQGFTNAYWAGIPSNRKST